MFFNRNQHCEMLERLIHIEGKIDRIEKSTSPIYNKFLGGGTAKPVSLEKYITKSFAQYGEDVLIFNLFQKLGIEKPSYIDIGAHHPYEISNTALFYLSGCRGTNVEANPNLIQAFYDERPDDRNICSGVGAEAGELPFYMIDDRCGRNSFKKARVEAFLEKSPDFSMQEVRNIKIRTLSDIIDEIGKIPDYMSIDIEGMEYEVLSNYDLKNRGPMVITLEIMRGNVEDGTKIIDMMKNAGYFMYLKIYSNITFVKKEWEGEIYSL